MKSSLTIVNRSVLKFEWLLAANLLCCESQPVFDLANAVRDLTYNDRR